MAVSNLTVGLYLSFYLATGIIQQYTNTTVYGFTKSSFSDFGTAGLIFTVGAMTLNFLGQVVLSYALCQLVYYYHHLMKTSQYQIKAMNEDGETIVTNTTKHALFPQTRLDFTDFKSSFMAGSFNSIQLVTGILSLSGLNPIVYTILKLLHIPANILMSALLLKKKVAILVVLAGSLIIAANLLKQLGVEPKAAKPGAIDPSVESIAKFVIFAVISAVFKGFMNPAIEYASTGLGHRPKVPSGTLSLYLLFQCFVLGMVICICWNLRDVFAGERPSYESFQVPESAYYVAYPIYQVGGPYLMSIFAIQKNLVEAGDSKFGVSFQSLWIILYIFSFISAAFVIKSTADLINVTSALAIIPATALKMMLIALIDVITYYIQKQAYSDDITSSAYEKADRGFRDLTNMYAILCYVFVMLAITLQYINSKREKAAKLKKQLSGSTSTTESTESVSMTKSSVSGTSSATSSSVQS